MHTAEGTFWIRFRGPCIAARCIWIKPVIVWHCEAILACPLSGGLKHGSDRLSRASFEAASKSRAISRWCPLFAKRHVLHIIG